MSNPAKKVLIVDDQPNLLIMLEFLLAQHGYLVKVARSGEEALEMLAAEVPDIIIMEVLLPYRNGFETCQIIRQRSELKAVKIILSSARGREQEVAKARALGADDFIIKPFSSRDLIDRVNHLVDYCA